jgi:hypothetical protein
MSESKKWYGSEGSKFITENGYYLIKKNKFFGYDVYAVQSPACDHKNISDYLKCEICVKCYDDMYYIKGVSEGGTTVSEIPFEELEEERQVMMDEVDEELEVMEEKKE